MAEKIPVRVTIKLTGPMKRSTFSAEEPQDATQEAIAEAIHWAWSTRLQILRLMRSIREELSMWGSKNRLSQRRAFSTTSLDEHSVVVSAKNLGEALRGLPRAVRGEVGIAESLKALELLRDVYEHWAEARRFYRGHDQNGRSARAVRKLKEKCPSADPWSFTIDRDEDDVIVADVVPLMPFARELRGIEARLLRFERRRKAR
jgi:hypothetical protein